MHTVDGKAPEVILVTGGAGYIASHCSVLLLEAGYEVVIVDNLCNSSQEALIRVADIAGRPLRGFYQVDLLDSAALEAVFQSHPFSAVIHFAGIKAVGESVKEPLRYYHNNITGTLNLLQCMRKFRVQTLVYSSSATVYGEPSETPILETAEIHPTSPYGWTKAMIEQIITDVTEVEGWQSVILRYFNPVGAHPSGRLGEAPQGVPNNLMPYLAQVAVGNLEKITILGSDYSTRDGTGIAANALTCLTMNRNTRLHPCHGSLSRTFGGPPGRFWRSRAGQDIQSGHRRGIYRERDDLGV